MSCRSKAEVVTHSRDRQAESVERAVHRSLSEMKALNYLAGPRGLGGCLICRKRRIWAGTIGYFEVIRSSYSKVNKELNGRCSSSPCEN